MDSGRATVYVPDVVPHPGETVVEYLEFFEWSQRDLARRTGLTPKTISELCNGKAPITASTALSLEKVFQRPAHFWLNLQRQFDEAEARRKQLVRTAQWKEWATKFPLREMKRRFSFLPVWSSGASDVETVLTFFGVSSPDSWRSVWTASDAAYRQTRRFKTTVEAVTAWVRATELVAAQLDVGVFDENRLPSSVEALRRLTRQSADQITEPVQTLCAAAGIAVVWVPELSETGISGCARWLNDRKALIGLTLRYKTDDQMWFTLFHELGHLVLHRRAYRFVLDNAEDDLTDRVVDPQMQRCEAEANTFAADTLIPPNDLSEFIRQKDFRSSAVHEFAEKVGVGPGIVVGRLQHDGILAPHQGNALKQKLDWRIGEPST